MTISAQELDQQLHNLHCEVEAGVQDAIGDNPDLMEDLVFSEIAHGIVACGDYPKEVVDEYFRMNGLVDFDE